MIDHVRVVHVCFRVMLIREQLVKQGGRVAAPARRKGAGRPTGRFLGFRWAAEGRAVQRARQSFRSKG